MQGQLLIFNINLLLDFTLQSGREWLVQCYTVDNTIELTGCVSGRPCSMAGSSILFLGSTCALGETLGGLWEREEGGKSEAVYGCR